MMNKGTLERGGGYVDQIFTLKQISGKKRKRERENNRVFVGFIDLEKAYDRVNREALRQVLRVYDVGSKCLSGIKSMYVDSLILKHSLPPPFTLRQTELLTLILSISFNSLPTASYFLNTCQSAFLLIPSYTFFKSIKPTFTRVFSLVIPHISALG